MVEWSSRCYCPFCGDENWACDHLVLDLGGGGEEGGVGLRAWGGLETRTEMLDALLRLIGFAWGETRAPSESSAIRARLDALTTRLPFGAEDWWCGSHLLDLIVDRIASDGDGSVGSDDELGSFLSIQVSDEGDAEEGSLLEWIWLDVMLRVLEDVPGLHMGDCEVASMTSGLYYLVWATDRDRAEADIAAAVSSMAARIQEALEGVR